ncbi:MAG: FAD-dependent oxidoreductase [Alphaproteobacteria bacterium]|nr:FAD-dependent oxidoreductase [Alphaproteobacteria bacterium]
MSPATRRCEVVIIGGGIAGLSASWELRDRDIVVLEAGLQVGGRFRTETRGRYWLNLGAHVLKEGGPMAGLAAEVGVPLVAPPGNFIAVAMKGRVVEAGNAAGALMRLPLSPAARLSLATVGLRMLHARRLPAAWLERMRFVDLLGSMHPDVEALMRVVANRLTGELDTLSALCGVTGFAHLWVGSRLNIAGGAAALPHAIAARLGGRVQTGSRASVVRQDSGGVSVLVDGPAGATPILADACVVAVPAPLARGLLPDLPTSLDAHLARMIYTPFVVAGFFTGESGPMPWDGLYAMAVPDRSLCMFFNSANALRTGPERRPGGAVVTYAVAERARALLDRDDEEITRRYLADLGAVFPALPDVVEEVVIQRWPLGTALAYPGRGADVAALAGGWGRVAFAGDHMTPIDGIDASESGRAAAKVVRAWLGAAGNSG